MHNGDVSRDRESTPKAASVAVSLGTNYTEHLAGVQNDNRYYYHHQE